MRGFALVVACAAALAACASPAPRRFAQDARLVLDARAAVPVERLAFDPLPAGTSVPFRLDDASPVVTVGGRRSYARGFVLPDVDGRVRLSIVSSGIGNQGGVFYPEVAFLDERFQPVGRIERERYALRASEVGNALSADAFLDAKAMRARYVLVTERPIAEAEEHIVQPTSTGGVPLVVPIGTMLVMWMIPTGSTAGPTAVVASPVGTLYIQVESPRLRTIERPAAAAPQPEPIR